MSDPTPLSSASRYIKSALIGAVLALAAFVCGAWWQKFTGQVPFDGLPLGGVAAVALIAGGVIGFVHHGTRRIRARGRLHEYGSWMLACTIGVFVVTSPELLQRGFWSTVLFALWLGVSCGLAFGVISRQLSGHRW